MCVAMTRISYVLYFRDAPLGNVPEARWLLAATVLADPIARRRTHCPAGSGLTGESVCAEPRHRG